MTWLICYINLMLKSAVILNHVNVFLQLCNISGQQVSVLNFNPQNPS